MNLFDNLFGSSGSSDIQSMINPANMASANSVVNNAVESTINAFESASQSPSTLGAFLKTGVSSFTNSLGVTPDATKTLQKVMPGVAAAGMTAVNDVFQRITMGSLNVKSFGPFKDVYFLDTLLSKDPTNMIYGLLPKSLMKIHAFVVLTDSLFRNQNVFGPQAARYDDFFNPEKNVRLKTSYAHDAYGKHMEHAAKHPFMFVVDFQFNAGYTSFNKTCSFMVNKIDRPNIIVEMEDVNLYNFRTKVPKATVHDPISMSIYDDVGNSTLDWFLGWLKESNPISTMVSSLPYMYQANAMNFPQHLSEPNRKYQQSNYSAGVGLLVQNNITLLKHIKVYHITQFGKYVDTYTYSNPKIIEAKLSTLSMKEDDPCELELRFVYDAVNIVKNQSFQATIGDVNACVVPDILKTRALPSPTPKQAKNQPSTNFSMTSGDLSYTQTDTGNDIFGSKNAYINKINTTISDGFGSTNLSGIVSKNLSCVNPDTMSTSILKGIF